MKKNLWKISVFAAIVLAIAMGIQACATNIAAAKANDITGTWTIKVIPSADTGAPPFTNFSSMTKDGLVINSDDVGLASLGVWEKVADHTYRTTFQGFFEQEDMKMRYQVRGTVELSADGEHFSGPFTNDIYDLDNNLLFSIGGNVDAERMHVVPLE